MVYLIPASEIGVLQTGAKLVREDGPWARLVGAAGTRQPVQMNRCGSPGPTVLPMIGTRNAVVGLLCREYTDSAPGPMWLTQVVRGKYAPRCDELNRHPALGRSSDFVRVYAKRTRAGDFGERDSPLQHLDQAGGIFCVEQFFFTAIRK